MWLLGRSSLLPLTLAMRGAHAWTRDAEGVHPARVLRTARDPPGSHTGSLTLGRYRFSIGLGVIQRYTGSGGLSGSEGRGRRAVARARLPVPESRAERICYQDSLAPPSLCASLRKLRVAGFPWRAARHAANLPVPRTYGKPFRYTSPPLTEAEPNQLNAGRCGEGGRRKGKEETTADVQYCACSESQRSSLLPVPVLRRQAFRGG